jgi:glycosyltransferase involved in cell wall biosynthesis
MTDLPLAMAAHPLITIRAIPARPSHVMRKSDYLAYLAHTGRLALRLRPQVVYASDPLGAGSGLLAARLTGATLVYHEHDPPPPGDGPLHWFRRAAARSAKLVIFPNAARAQLAQAEIDFPPERLRIVWNMPRVAELPTLSSPPAFPLLLYYHGSITPDRVPEVIVPTLVSFGGRVRLRMAGYEAPGQRGYLTRLSAATGLIDYLGLIEERDALLASAARNHVGLACVPLGSVDTTMAHLAGASNKAFDYMAAGQALLVSDLPEWREMFTAPGYGLACDPGSAESLRSAIGWMLDHPDERYAMGQRGRSKIETDWNYDAGFAPIIDELSRTVGGEGPPRASQS